MLLIISVIPSFPHPQHWFPTKLQSQKNQSENTTIIPIANPLHRVHALATEKIIYLNPTSISSLSCRCTPLNLAKCRIVTTVPIPNQDDTPPLSSALNLCPGKSNFTNYKSQRFVSRRSNVASQHPALVTAPEMDLREICEVMKSSWLWAGDSVKGDEGYPHGAGDNGVMEIEGD